MSLKNLSICEQQTNKQKKQINKQQQQQKHWILAYTSGMQGQGVKIKVRCIAGFHVNVMKFENQTLLGLLNFYGHPMKKSLNISFHKFSSALYPLHLKYKCHVEFLRFLLCVTLQWCHDKAVVLEKRSSA